MVAFSSTAWPLRSKPDATSTTAPRMQLTSDTDSWGAERPRGIDRRTFPRRRVSLKVHGRRLDHSVDARREPYLYLDMKDVSVGGLAATSQTALKVGERVAVFFPPEGTSRGWDAYGRVLRVEPAELGYQVAVSFDPLPAA